MKHRIGFNKLSRTPSHRKALHRNMVTSLFRHERIRTTKAKASAIRRTAEKMITRAKVDSVHNRRMVGRDLKDKAILAKLFTEIGPRFQSRPGGYTRMLKLGQRQGDASEMVLLELVEDQVEAPKKEPKGKSRRAKKSDVPSANVKPSTNEPAEIEEPAETAESATAEHSEDAVVDAVSGDAETEEHKSE
jgi:large subunit ribosomal protein L17